MPDYVYALHDFAPENEDEVDFRAGERIEVVEKDDLYGDGWWQGRNLAGKQGLFPVSYTASIPPAASNEHEDTTDHFSTDAGITRSTLHPLREESESGTPPIISPVPKAAPVPTFLQNGHADGYESDAAAHDDPHDLPYGHKSSASEGEMMRATLTDVQKAIEQLGRGGSGTEDHDGARSFSFASSKDGADTETDDTDFDLSDLDGGADAEGTENWHKNARRKLAAKAKRAVEEAEKLEAMMNGGALGQSADAASGRREVIPPIEVEMSDESDAEDEHDYTRSRFQRNHPGIMEEEEEDAQDASIPTHSKDQSSATETQKLSNDDLELPPKDDNEVLTATAQTVSFPVFTPPTVVATPPPVEHTPQPAQEVIVKSFERTTSPSPLKNSYPTPVSPPAGHTTTPIPPPPAPEQSAEETRRSSAPFPMNGLPSPSASSHLGLSKHSSIVSSSSAPPMTTPQPQHQATSAGADFKSTHPSEWTLEQVLAWLKSKGFDQDVCEKFTEQEITGDVLMELDANVLKTEIGIMAYGKRIRIANAVAELRRPPSIEYSDHHISSDTPSPMQNTNSHLGAGSNGISSTVHSRTQSQSGVSHNSYPGTTTTANTTVTQGYPQSVQSSSGSPAGYGQQQQQYLNGHTAPFVQESPANSQQSDAAAAASAGVYGLGIGLLPNGKRPANLSLSPSDGALKDSAQKFMPIPSPIGEDERGHMSESEVAPTATSMRRRIFGRSHDSAASAAKSSNSKESPASSPTVRDSDKDSVNNTSSVNKVGAAAATKDDNIKVKDTINKDSSTVRHRPKKSIDGTRSGDRLSIFGGTFGGSLGKHRKPPPSAGEDVPTNSEKSSKFSLPRLHGSSIRKASSASQRPSTPGGSPEKTDGNFNTSPSKETDRHTLRKRTSSAPFAHPVSNVVSGLGPVNGLAANGGLDASSNVIAGPLKQGQNILEQIGEPDFAGYMRKKGERYNAWKLRYFVLKGPHLFFLRSNNKTETRLKGYVHIVGYKVTVDENIDPGRYGFRIDHDNDKTHYFSSDEKSVIRDWMKAIMKATIGRDYTRPVVSSCNIPTIPLVVAQAMNPAPRPPSPSARDATQRAMRREDTTQLSSRDARVLMGLPGDTKEERARVESFFSTDGTVTMSSPPISPISPRKSTAPPPRPSREMRRSSSIRTATTNKINSAEDALIDWANSHLPEHLQITDPSGPLCGGLALLRLAESIRGRPSSPPVPDSAFPADPNDDKLDGLFRLFDFLLDNDVKMGSVSINDVRQGKRDKILQLLKALKLWEDKRKALANTIVQAASPNGFMTPLVI